MRIIYLCDISLQQTLKAIPLKVDVTRVEKLGTRAFVVSFTNSTKTFRYSKYSSLSLSYVICYMWCTLTVTSMDHED